jgi:predicted nucleotidyltransferase
LYNPDVESHKLIGSEDRSQQNTKPLEVEDLCCGKVASVLDLQDCHTQAKSPDTLMKHVQETIRLCLEMEAGAVDSQKKWRCLVETLPFDTKKLQEIFRSNDVEMVGVFGSMARGEATEQSDIDLLVRFSRRKSLLEMVKLEREVSTALGRKVDLLTEGAISPYLRDRVKRELRVIYRA